VEAVDTEKRAHATQLCREAAREGYDVVVAFGGDGTVNEAANGLVGTKTPLTCLPGGSTNVWCRTIGIPADVVDATEHLLRMADDFNPFPVDLGRVNERHFVFSAGVGLDASVVRRVDEHPLRKAKYGAWYYTYAALREFGTRYLVHPPHVRVEVEGRELDGVTVVVQNSDPFTFFRTRPIRVGEGAGLDTGSLSLTVLERASILELSLIPRLLSKRARTVQKQRRIAGFPGVTEATVRALDDRSFPLHVDGDYIADFDEVQFGVNPAALLAAV
jgi:diacylglycerol kinase family enzyme